MIDDEGEFFGAVNGIRSFVGLVLLAGIVSSIGIIGVLGVDESELTTENSTTSSLETKCRRPISATP
ncbi:hypothetical protein [Halopiger thermotolerans]